jgi:hypothetical protein
MVLQLRDLDHHSANSLFDRLRRGRDNRNAGASGTSTFTPTLRAGGGRSSFKSAEPAFDALDAVGVGAVLLPMMSVRFPSSTKCGSSFRLAAGAKVNEGNVCEQLRTLCDGTIQNPFHFRGVAASRRKVDMQVIDIRGHEQSFYNRLKLLPAGQTAIDHHSGPVERPHG